MHACQRARHFENSRGEQALIDRGDDVLWRAVNSFRYDENR
jgi:hypothetical protein